MIYHQIDDFPQKSDVRSDYGDRSTSLFPNDMPVRSSNKINSSKSKNYISNYFLPQINSIEELYKFNKLFSVRSLYLASSFVFKIFLLASSFLLLMIGFSILFQRILGLNNNELTTDKDSFYQFKRLHNEFKIFQKNYSRNYSSYDEINKRFIAFSLNMYLLEQRLDQERKQGIEGQTIWGVTEFFDWTEDEIAKLLIPHNYNEQIRMRRLKKIIKVETKQGYVRPKQWDWREKGVVTHVKNQLNCGSCWAFSVVGMVETMHAIHNGTLVRLSEQQLIDCDSAENGCEGGFRPYALRYIRDKGLLSENAYPYRGNDGKCQLPSGPIDPTQRVFIDEWRSLPSDEDQIADWIATNGPVTFGMNATKSMYHYKGGIFSPSPEECNYESLGSHSMEVIGYGVNDKDIPYWILKNSWGSGYGVNGGYLHMRRGVNSCGLTREVYSALIKK
uniref:Peptidase C1A papain C-terminal domain-containing protein n=2 Tax=Meloidogyne TaxID=189290 RepID=A0A6V7VA17_MELEN|nr:unnamed protein product [Meloidogyne enterolobii]